MNRHQALALTVFGALVAGVGAAIAYDRKQRLGAFQGLGRALGFVKEITPGAQEHYSAIIPIGKRVKLMQKLVELSIKHKTMGPKMRALALSITNGCEARDDRCEARAIYQWVKKNIRYTGDVAPFVHTSGRIEAVDMFQAAYVTAFGTKGEDCDGHAILTATLLTLNGIPARFRVTAPKGASDWGHVYSLWGTPRNDPKRWIAIDTTLPGGDHFGVEVPYSRFRDFVA